MFAFLLFAAFLITANANNNEYGREVEDEKIVGGRIVEITEFPYQVSIHDEGGFWCGGSIISLYHVLSASHCVRFGSKPFLIRAGSSFYAEGGSTHVVEDAVIFGTQHNMDVSVLRVREPFVFDATRQPVQLFTGKPEPGTYGVITGWGEIKPQFRKISRQLRAVEVPIVSRDVCNDIYNGTRVGEIVDGQICAGYLEEGGKDACQGDSGSPLVINGKQVGIASMGYGCARREEPGVYADVGFYSEWIKKQIS